MSARIYTGAEARALREAATVGPWLSAAVSAREADNNMNGVFVLRNTGADLESVAEVHDDRCGRLLAAAPDLAASVEHHEARAERAEAEAVSLRSSLSYLERQVDHEGAAQQATWRVLGGEGSAPNADAVTERAAAVVAERDAASAHAEELTRALADGRVELRQRADDAERVAADLRDDLERLRAERDALRAIVEGRAEPPTTEAPDAR